ncbi:MAG: sulfite exporter TauE/SafE family protein [Pseudomonadota bacterium]
MTLIEVVLINVVLFAGAYIQGIVGFGIGIFCASLFAVYAPHMVPVSMILLSTLLAVVMLLRGRNDVSIQLIKWPIIGSGFGIICAGYVVTLLTSQQFDIVFGILLLCLVAISLTKPLLSGKFAGICAGYLSGLMGTITAIGGPPMGLLLKDTAPSVIRANLALFFLISSVWAIAVLYIAGALGQKELLYALASCPGMLLGYGLSQKVKLFQNQKFVQSSILIVSFVCAVYVINRGLN